MRRSFSRQSVSQLGRSRSGGAVPAARSADNGLASVETALTPL